MFVPRPLASRRQKTRLSNTDNSRFGDSGEVGSRNSRLTAYSRCYIDATRPSNDTFSACYRFFGGLGRPKAETLPWRRAQSGGPPGGRAQYPEARGRASRGSRTVRFDSFRDPGSEIAVTKAFWSSERAIVSCRRRCYRAGRSSRCASLPPACLGRAAESLRRSRCGRCRRAAHS